MSEEIKEIALKLVDPRNGTAFAKSKTAFLSFSTLNNQIHLSAFLARKMGFMSGDRIGFTTHPTNNLIWFIYKTSQRHRTLEMKIRNGSYSINSKEMVQQIGQAFHFNFSCTEKIRLYVNHMTPVTHTVNGDETDEQAIMLQLYDIPHLRKDFDTPEQHAEYTKFIHAQNYIIKK